MCHRIVSTGYFLGVIYAIKNGHHDIVRYLLEIGYVNTSEMDILDVAIGYGDGHNHEVGAAIWRPGANGALALRAKRTMQSHLFDRHPLDRRWLAHGRRHLRRGWQRALPRYIFAACEKLFHIKEPRAYRDFALNMTGQGYGLNTSCFKNKHKVMAVMLVVLQAKEQIPEAFARCRFLDRLFKEVGCGGVEVPAKPIDFRIAAQNISSWLQESREKLEIENKLYLDESDTELDTYMEEKYKQRAAVEEEASFGGWSKHRRVESHVLH
jgi:hypothetical protein